jgi:serine/threonine protein kinase/Tfp pilus assembly protein PilF
MKCPQCGSENTSDSRYCKSCAAPLAGTSAPTETVMAPVKELTTGSTFAGRYQVIEELGRGGMGQVYRVLDKKLGEEVALKLIKPEIAADEETILRFRNELRTARNIGHPNVTRMYDLGEDEGTHYITMEYVRGEDLKSFIRRSGRLTVAKAVAIAGQVSEGLAEAHRQGVVHRDLKPQNIMIDRDGNARIMDFGIARSLKPEGITGGGVMIGTPEYMSPEQVEGKAVDPRSDLYSLGIILYEMLTGRVPFTGDSVLSVAMKQKSEPPPDPQQQNSQIPAALSRLILTCLEKEKEKRLSSASEVLLKLGRIETDLSTTERARPGLKPETKPAPARHFFPKRKAAAIVILAAVAVMVIGLIFVIRGPKKAPPPQEAVSQMQWKNSIAVLPFADLSPAKDQGYFCDGMTEDIIGRLSRVSDLKVISRSSVIPYKNTDKSIKDIAKELGVASILEGSIQREGEMIRVNAQLIDAASGFHLWSDKYDRKLDGLFAIQDEISLAIADALKVKLSADSLAAYKTGQTGNMELYELYLQGMYFINSNYVLTYREEDFANALRFFHKVIEIDPAYAQAYIGLAWAYFHKYQITQNEEDSRQFVSSAVKAYQLDPELPLSNFFKGFLHFLKGEYDTAFDMGRVALRKDPNNLFGNIGLGYCYYVLGLYRTAIPSSLKAVELSPYYFWSKIHIAWCYDGLGEYGKGERYFRDALRLNPENPFTLVYYAEHLTKAGKYDEAEKMIREAERIAPGFHLLPRFKAQLLAARGEKEKALALDKSTRVYALLGMNDEAIQIMQKYIDGGGFYPYLNLVNNPFYDKLRDDPRFKKIVAQSKEKYEEFSRKYGNLQ